MQLSLFFPIMAAVARGFEVKSQFGVGASGDRYPVGVDTHLSAPLPGRSLRWSTAAALALALTGCGGASTTDPLGAPDAAPTALSSGPDNQATPSVSESSTDDSDSGQGATTSANAGLSTSTAADVILVKPAGHAALPLASAPAVKFKALPTPDTTNTIASRATARSPLVADGGRSTVASETTPQSGNVTISWDPPTENADGSSISDLAGYRVYQGNQESLTIVQELNETGAGERRLTQIPNVTSANSCFAVTAFDTSSNESALGDVVCKAVIVPAPPTNNSAPALTSVTQLSSNDGQAEVQLLWQPPATSSAAAGSSVAQYSIYHGSQSQLFKVQEISDAAARSGSSRTTTLSGIGGEQACFALTARYTDGTETSLGEIVCVALVHSAPPQPGTELRPFNVTVEMIASNTAQIGWDKPNTVVSSADATAIDRYDLYQGSRSQVYKLSEIHETGAAGSRRTTTVENVFDGSHCFALTATDESRRQSALSTIVCANVPDTSTTPTPTPPTTGTVGVTNVTAQETSPGSVAVAWDAPQLVAAGQPIANLAGYNIYQGSNTQLFKVAELAHNSGAVRQQIQRTEVDSSNACFAITAYDSNGYEAPLSEVVCATISGTSSVPQYGIVPPTELATSALGGSTTVTLTWLASGAAATGAADPNVNRYNIYQGNHDRLFKVRQVKEEHDADPRTSTTFTGVTPESACFAITAQYRDLRESRLSDIVCRDD